LFEVGSQPGAPGAISDELLQLDHAGALGSTAAGGWRCAGSAVSHAAVRSGPVGGLQAGKFVAAGADGGIEGAVLEALCLQGQAAGASFTLPGVELEQDASAGH